MELLEVVIFFICIFAFIAATEKLWDWWRKWKKTKTLEFKVFRLRIRVGSEKEEKDDEE